MSANRSVKTARALDIMERILEGLNEPMICPELSRRLNISERACRYYVQYLRETKKIHISGWTYFNADKAHQKRDIYSLGAPKEIEVKKPKKRNGRDCFVKVIEKKRKAHCDIAASWIPKR